MIPAILVLSAIVLFHEFGHFLLAKLNGITVIEFSLGFGPRLLTTVSKKSGTRYSVKLFLFGGSCAMLGESGDLEEEEAESEVLNADAERAVPEGSFNSKSPLARMSVIAAGPIFNFILALIFAVVIVSWAGYDAPVLYGVTEGQAAEAAGLQAGDVITKLGNTSVGISRDITLYMTTNGSKDVPVRYKRYSEYSGKWETYNAVLTPSGYQASTGRYYLGVQLSPYRQAATSLPELFKYGIYETRFWIRSVIESLKMLVAGKVESDDIAGPVRIVTIIDETVQENKQYGFVTVLMNLFNLMVMFSANLGVMNLLPFPALDGGRLVFLLWEFLTGHPANRKIENAVNMAGMTLLMLFMIFVLAHDIITLI